MSASRRWLLAALLVLAAAAWTGSASAGIFVVDNANDNPDGVCAPVPTGDCSLRSAIIAANADPDPSSVIQFQIGTGQQTIQPASALPVITHPTTIDGHTQPFWSPGSQPLIELDGSAAGNSANGIYITAGNSTVRGLSIVGFDFDGIRLETNGGNTITGNWLGVDASGNPDGNHAYGLDMRFGSGDNVVGGSNTDDRNVISANGAGSSIPGPYSGLGAFGGADGTVIDGNYIGTDPEGSSFGGFGNAFAGVLLRSHSNVTLGEPGAGNVISGNGTDVVLDSTTSDTVAANKVGTSADGLDSLNDQAGVVIQGTASANMIGGTSAVAGNLIGGPTNAIEILGAQNNLIKGNRIGVDAEGGNLGSDLGVDIESGDGNVVGREPLDPPGAANLIANSFDTGVFIRTGSNEKVYGNDLRSNDRGIALGTGSEVAANNEFVDNAITGSNDSAIQVVTGTGTLISQNTITDNFETAIDIRGDSTTATVSQNSLSNNAFGIDLNDGAATQGPTQNDSAGHTGPNSFQNFPVITSAQARSDGTIFVAGSLNSAASTDYQIELFVSQSCNTLGYGEGELFSGSVSAATNPSGNLAFTDSVSGEGGVITATATNIATGETSEFSQCFSVTGQGFVVDNNGDASGQACTAASNDCSLRSAIEQANADPSPNVVSFSVGVGSVSIQPATPLPSLTGQTVIDGRTQPGWVGPPNVEVNGASAGSGADGLVLGDNSTIRGLIVDNWSGIGIAATGANNVVQGNFIGTDASGNPAPNGFGVYVLGATNTTIGGGSSGARNVIAGNTNDGVDVLNGAATTIVRGNWIGINDADAATPNGNGVHIETSTGTVVGGSTVADRNVISGNTTGIRTSGTPTAAKIEGNYIGTNSSGNFGTANQVGVQLSTAGVTVGGTGPGEGNVISGNFDSGITVTTSGNPIYGNWIGLNADGTSHVANNHGISVTAGSPVIGGDAAGQGNVISGNNEGILIAPSASAVSVLGNFIGTDPSGTQAIRNTVGVDIDGSPNNVVGDGTIGGRNVISGNNASPGAGTGVRVQQSTATGNAIRGNYIGPDVFGTSAISDHQVGVEVFSFAAGTVIGGTAPGQGNLISGNNEGITTLDTTVTNTTIEGNLVGTDRTGLRDLGNTDAGIRDDANSTTIGGTVGTTPGGACTGACNVFSGNDDYGIDLEGGAGTHVLGNYVGVGVDGLTPVPNHIPTGQGTGIYSEFTDGAVIGGTTPAARNVIGANDTNIELFDQSATVVEGNYVGVGTDGSTNVGARQTPNPLDGVGIYLTGVTNTTIGGAVAGAGNVISGNQSHGVVVEASDTTTIQGNRVGTDAVGSHARPNGGNGVLLEDQGSATSSNTVIGGITPTPGTEAGNVISGNGSEGIEDDSTGGGTVIQGNLVGTDASGTAALGNGDQGILIDNSGTTVGGVNANERNIVSGNAQSGILLFSSSSTTVQGNYVGTNAAGTAPVANGIDGIGVNAFGEGGSNQIIGNVASGNSHNGIAVFGGSDHDVIQGNDVGVGADGVTPVGNGNEGVRIQDSTNVTIGGLPATANTIANNGSKGVNIFGASTGVSVQRNSIYANGGIGIDLGNNGVTPNDASPDADTGANNLQNFPVITSAQLTGGGNITIDGTIDSAPVGTGYVIDLYDTPSCDPSGFGQGETYLGTVQPNVDGNGHAAWTTNLSSPVVEPGDAITATATKPGTGDTSEFSQCVAAANVAAPLNATLNLSTPNPNVQAGAQTVPISGIDVSTLTQGAGGTTRGAALGGIALGGIDIAQSALGGIALGGIGLTPAVLNSALGGVRLSDIPLDPPATWDQVLAGTPLQNVPLNTVTLADVLSLPNPPTSRITLGQVNLQSSALGGIGLGAMAIGTKPLSTLPLNPAGTNSPSENLQDWCTAINNQPGYTCTDPSTLSAETVMSETIKGVALGGIGLDGIALGGIDLSGTALGGIALGGISLHGTALGGIALGGINITGSALGGIALGGIPLPLLSQIVNCAGGYCTPGLTLGQAAGDGKILPNATLGLLDGHLGSVTVGQLVAALRPGSGLTLHDLFAVLLGSAAYNWSQLDLNTFPLADYSSDGGVAHYQADFQVTGGMSLSQNVDIHATVPAGGRYVKGSSQLKLGASTNPIPDPDLGGGGGLTWHIHALVGQNYTLLWDAKPGLDLGSSTVAANIQVGSLTVQATPTTTNVIQTFNTTSSLTSDTNNDPNTAPTLSGNTLNVSQLTKGDTDYYRVPIGAYGSKVTLTLSHIPAGSDYDLAVAGPPAPRLRGPALNGIPITNEQVPDSSVELNSRAQQLPPEVLQDVPVDTLTLNGRVLRAVSDNRGNTDEKVTLISEGESGFYTVQISDYQGDSPDPYVLQVQSDPPPDFGVCAPRAGISNGTVGAPAPVTAATQTLILVDEQRMISTFGSTATATMIGKLNALAARTDVNGTVVRVENGPGIAAAYNTWDATPCSPQLANNVVRSIGSYLDSLQQTATNVKYIVVVGGDDIIPFARVPDETQIANESTYAQSLGVVNNEYLGSIGDGFLFTDDVWGERGAPDFLGHELFVPEQAVGRLVESPADIGKTLDNFQNANGLLSPTSSLTTGYDFLSDGAQSVNQPFAAAFGTNAKTLINETWDRNALLNALFPSSGPAPVLNSINAHFDHHRLLPASENAAMRDTSLVTTDDITSRGANIMTGRLGFSMGCHSGLAASDAIFGAANLLHSDWAQAMLGSGAAGWIGNTGYGIGDTTDVAYTERLHALFSRKLDGTLSVGQALEQAKQAYLGTLAVLTPYDAKVMMEATLYGLPMLRLGNGVPPTPPPPPPLHTDPATNLQAASFDVSPTFTPVPAVNPTYYKADSGIQSTPRRPLQPLSSLDMTEPGMFAHGAMINLLTSSADQTGFNPSYSQVTTDSSADDPTLKGVSTFPSKIQAISTFSGLSSVRQRLNLVVGLFRSNGPSLAGTGTERLYTRVAGDVLYSTSNDWRPPDLGALESLTVGSSGAIGFGTNVTDLDQNGNPGTVKEVVVLYRDCNGVWRTSTLAPAGGNRWSGSGTVTPASCQNIDYYLEAADAAGNVAVSSNKVQVEPLVAPPDVVPPGASPITHSLSPSPSASGWYPNNVQVTLSSADPIQYSLDGQPYADYTGPFTVTGDGTHFVEATTKAGAMHTFGFVIDGNGPSVSFTKTPATPDVGSWYVFNVAEKVTATDAGSGIAAIRCVLDPASAPTSYSQLPASCPYLGSGANLPHVDGMHTLYAASIDNAGNAGPVASDTYNFDGNPPTTTMNPLAAIQTAIAVSPSWTGSDGTGSGVKNFDIRYRQAPSSSSTFGSYVSWQSATPALTAVFNGTLGSTTCFSGRARDNAGWTASQYSAEVCTTTPLDDSSLTRSFSGWSTVSASDLYNGSVSRSTTVGSTLTSPTMAGKQIGVLVTKQPGGGTIQLRWNGNTQVTQSLSAATRTPKQLVSFTLSSVQSGTLQVYVSGAGTVDVDAAGAYKTP